MDCKCGCGDDSGTREYVWGHKTRHVRPTEKKKLCQCGCGEMVTTRFVKGHIHRLKAKQKDASMCACGCGETTAPGRRFLSGHNSKTLEGLAAKSAMMQKLWEEHPEKFEGRSVWSEGLTKETDERLGKHSQWMKESFTDEKRKHYQELGKNEFSKHLPHPTGSDHPNWQGGVATIYQMLYGSKRLYQEWKFPILQAASFRCPCGATSPLNVHHHPVKMRDLVHEVCGGVDVSQISFEARKELCERIIDRHLNQENPAGGVCLCVDCHRLAHKIDPDVD